VRQVESSSQRSYLVAPSPDGHWVSYYQRSSTDPSDRFVVDAWVIDVATDERHKLVQDATPRAWNAASKGVVLGERPYLMATVPDGELVPTEGPLIAADGTRTVMSPDGQLRATVATSTRGSVALELFEPDQTDPFMSVPTGLAQIQMAWSPDSSRLAFVSSMAGRDGIVWRLRMIDVAERTVAPVESTLDLYLHSVVWLAAGDC
jgi:Tol biopolymer transport system component